MTDFDPITAVNTLLERKTDREREEEARYQAEKRAALHLPSELDIRAQLGARMVMMAQTALEATDDDFEQSRLAEGYALQGDYRKAATLTKDSARKTYYEQIIAAVENPNKCSCPPKNGNLSNIFTKDRILFDGQVREVLACAICGHIRC